MLITNKKIFRGIGSGVALLASCILSDGVMAETVTDLSEAAESVAGTPDSQARPVVVVCVGLNNKATGQDDVTVPPTQQQIEQNLTPDEEDLLRRCADVIQAGGLGIQAQEATPEDNAEAATALRQIAPDEIAAQGTVTVNAVNTQQTNVAARIAALQSGLRGFSVRRLSLRMDDSRLAGDDLQRLAGGAAGDPQRNSRLGVFLSGDVGSGDKETTSREAGFDFDNQSLTIGVDYFLDANAFVGVALGINTIDMDIADNGGGLETDNMSLSLYGSLFQKNDFYLNGFFDYTTSDFDSRRNLDYTLDKTTGGCCVVTESGRVTVKQNAIGNTDGREMLASLNMGYERGAGAWSYGPVFDLTYASLKIDGFSESMSNPDAAGRGLALTFLDQTIESFRSVLGVKLNHVSSMNWGVLSKQLRVDWHHEFKNDARVINSFYKFDPGKTVMTLKSDEPDADFYSLALDLSAGLANGRSAFISYSTLIGLDNVTASQISAGLRLEF